MSLKLRRYPDYRESRLRWIREIPQHWEAMPNRALFMEVNERGYPSEQMLSVTMGKGVIPQNQLLADSSKKDSSNLNKSAYKLVKPNDVAYNKMRAWQGAIGVSHYRGIVSPAYVVMRPRSDQQYPGYYHYLFRTPAFAKEAERWSYGITSDQWSLRGEHFRLIYSPAPPLYEQRQIGAFLTHFDRRVDRLIRSKLRLITLLEEQKLAVVHRRVTRGLDPDIRLKPSGFPWVGDIPEHWEAASLRRFLAQGPRNGISPPIAATGGVITFSISALRDRQVRLDGHVKYASISSEDAKSFLVREGDVLVVRGNGSLNLVGRAGLVTGPVPSGCIYPDTLIRLRPSADVNPEFLVAVLDAAGSRQQIELFAKSATGLNKISGSKLSAVILAIPPPAEQEAIVRALNIETQQVSNPIASLTRQISLLREYRTRLFGDVVTGQLDVRGVSLPSLADADAEDPEADLDPPLDDSDDADLLNVAESLDEDGGD